MGTRTAAALGGSRAVVPDVDNFSGGMECDSISSLNNNAKDFRSCIELAEGRTGESAAGCVAYVATHFPPWWHIEQVRAVNVKDKDSPE